jgi:uncharacterized protein YjhX (UPF0386 family)
MLTRIKIKNFKKLDDIDIELGKSVVFIGPNNSGKTAALQALALWNLGVQRWYEKKGNKSAEKRSGVTINRKDLVSIPVPSARLLWKDLHLASLGTPNIFIDIEVEGVTEGKSWKCGLEFYYGNEEVIYCRPLRLSNNKQPERMSIPSEALNVKVGFLPPMSGLEASEPKVQPGWINVMLGQGQTARVLRNICYQVYVESPRDKWLDLKDAINKLFGITLIPPDFVEIRGQLEMSYKEPTGVVLDLSAAGTGFLQTLLLLAYLYAKPGAVLLLDEPDAHLEFLRQQQTYKLITEIAEKQGSQIIAASHSEVVLREAADKDIVIAFLGKPYRINDRGAQVIKSLKEIGFDQYYQAEQTGWVLYLEGSTDLSILQAFATTLNHDANKYLERPFVYYVGNQPSLVKNHFWGLKAAKLDLVGVAIFDRLDRDLPNDMGAQTLQWKRREIENYLCLEKVLLAYAIHDLPDDLFKPAEASRREQIMRELITDLIPPIALRDPHHQWWINTKVTDEFLDILFEKYFEKLELPNLLRKTDYHILAKFIKKQDIDPEIIEKLDAIVEVARKASPR